MLKKLMLAAVAVVVLTGAELLLAEEKTEVPQVRRRQIRRLEVVPEQPRRQRTEQGVLLRSVEATQQRRRQRTGTDAERGPMEIARDKPQPIRPGENRPAQQMFGRWLDELINAYRENDREKMGQLLRKMNQVRSRWQKRLEALGATGRRGLALRERAEKRRGEGERQPGQFRWGRGWRNRSMGRWGMGLRGRRMMMRLRGRMAGPGRGLRPRGVSGLRPNMLRPLDKPQRSAEEEPILPALPEDIVGPRPDMPSRRMGGWGWGRGLRPRGPRIWDEE
jgi:hypothetical protein